MPVAATTASGGDDAGADQRRISAHSDSGDSAATSSDLGPTSPAWPQPTDLIHLLAGRWIVPILAELDTTGRRYQDLHDAIEGISHKVLTETLRRAERDGLIRRQIDSGRVETATLYQLTDLGASLADPLAILQQWTDQRWLQVLDARDEWDRRTDHR